jgi:hypothetical protein
MDEGAGSETLGELDQRKAGAAADTQHRGLRPGSDRGQTTWGVRPGSDHLAYRAHEALERAASVEPGAKTRAGAKRPGHAYRLVAITFVSWFSTGVSVLR